MRPELRRHLRAMCLATILAVAAAPSLLAQAPFHRGFRSNADVAVRAYVPAGRVRIVAWDRDSVDVAGTLGKNSSFFGGGGGAVTKLGVEARTMKDSVLADADLTISVP